MMRTVGLAMILGLVCTAAPAQGTKLWTVDRYDAMEKGTAQNVALGSEGRLEPGPATKLLYSDSGGYVWSVASDGSSGFYVGLGGISSGSAKVIRIAAEGRPQTIFDGKESGVQAVKVGRDGSVFAATSPDGKVYRMEPGAAKGPSPAEVVFDPAQTEEKPKYLWDVAVGAAGELYVATGAPAVVYRVPAGGGRAEVLFKTADQHIRCLMLAANGMLWAGSDGAGVIYRIATKERGAKPFAVYAAPRREITSLAMNATGDVFAAGVGAKGATSLPALPVTGAAGVTITFVQPGSTTATGTNTLVPEGSEIYRIAADRTPEKLLTLKDEVVYALAMQGEDLMAGTGNQGRVFRVDTKRPGGLVDVAHVEAGQATAFGVGSDGLLVGTSNGGKVYRLSRTAATDATYTSEVFDAAGYAKWGRAEVRGAGDFVLSARTGNVENPLMGWSDWAEVGKDGRLSVPAGRFAQWRAVLREGSSVDSVGLNYLQRNVAPVVDEMLVQPGARVTAAAVQALTAMVQIQLPVATGAVPAIVPDANTAPLAAQKDKTAITVRWAAHDDNGDEMVFSVWYRGAGERNWRLLKEKLSERYLSFDSALLPDGTYELKVEASDAPDHTPGQALAGSKVSEPFVVDTTPPVPGALEAQVEGVAIHARLAVRDASSPIAHAEYSVDAGPWQFVAPVGEVSDGQSESYDFRAEIPHATAPVTDAKEHVLAVRVYDRYDNMAAVKAVVH